MRETFLYLLLGHLLTAGVASDCVPVQACLICNFTAVGRADSCRSCLDISCLKDAEYANISSGCKRAFQVSINTTGSDVAEGDAVTLTCLHDLVFLNLTFWWTRDGKKIEKEGNRTKLFLKKAISPMSGKYVCHVKSPCGVHESSPHTVKVKNNSVILVVVCGVIALGLLLTMGLLMKYKLKRDNERHRKRRERRAQDESRGAPHPNVVTS